MDATHGRDPEEESTETEKTDGLTGEAATCGKTSLADICETCNEKITTTPLAMDPIDMTASKTPVGNDDALESPKETSGGKPACAKGAVITDKPDSESITGLTAGTKKRVDPIMACTDISAEKCTESYRYIKTSDTDGALDAKDTAKCVTKRGYKVTVTIDYGDA